MTTDIQAIKGMHDALPGQTPDWQQLEQQVQTVLESYGYAEIRMPILEKTELFHRSIGTGTDIVNKEMYTFGDRNDEQVTLRPEGTASCIRAVLEHNLLASGGALRVWYGGPMFRYERPQKGRFRQFHQIGAEAFGIATADIDAELILICKRLWQVLGIEQVKLELNTLGSAACREQYRTKLVEYFSDHKDRLDADSERRLQTNPLRILDSKNPDMQDLIQAAPPMTDYLDAESTEHFEHLQSLLRAADLDFTLNPRLVRGLDYYNHTVFEWITDQL
ncbi:MAG: histidine--tRNA ligase, partial [Gammaproteobacteria bacterium]